MGRNTKGNVSIESAAYIVFDSSSVWCNWLLNFQSSMRTSSYEKVSGYITDVEETSELTKAGYKPRYNYIIHWFRDGEEYQRAVYEALSEPDESATEFWASLDNTDAIASEPAGIRTEAYLNWLVAALSAILGG
ncbi:MAG: hypothetical protein ACLR09_08960 [Gallintestinimicrobium sp.]